ncbi:MAG: hypothetical protein ACK4UN_18565 [Limisphaerales bacterium]
MQTYRRMGQLQKPPRTLYRGLFAAIIAATLIFSVAPDLTKPLFVKYYRVVYTVELAQR